jgi:hypothetical protein
MAGLDRGNRWIRGLYNKCLEFYDPYDKFSAQPLRLKIRLLVAFADGHVRPPLRSSTIWAESSDKSSTNQLQRRTALGRRKTKQNH